ncbi:hypothetical protein [Caulobacter sp. RHG1]|uniref:hypothetical protein n=1 Tax=Caulobacter sp. (strain RHG1) TaxID=2545762 RepID=UPI001553BD84|nr:hypothetical protein [Caulobacter sp. RHG1]NQE62938.1 hypothetical protein [Caulobacter sp. RHG1]
MNVRAKFYVTEIKHVVTHQPDTVCATIVMAPVYGDGTDNAAWSKWTPNGKLEMTVTNPAAIERFDLGKSYYLDFTPVPEPVAG